MYNITNMTEVVNLQTGMLYANEILGDLWGIGILFVIFVIMIGTLTSKGWPFFTAFPAASFLITVLAILGVVFGIIGETPLVICLAFTALSVLLFFRGHDSG